MKVLKRIAIGVGLLALVLWIAGAALVMFWDDGGPLGELGPQSEGVWIFPGGYTDSFETIYWEGGGDEPPEDAYRESKRLQRGPLDRAAAEFPLSLRFSARGDPFAAVTLQVTSDADWPEKGKRADWLSIGTAMARAEGGWWVATIAEARAPASACGYRVEVIYADREERGGFAKTLPTAPTFLGRLYDRVAWWPLFRWLPDLR